MAGVDNLAFQLQAVSARLKELGETGLARELSRGIGKAVKPLPDRIRSGLTSYLPHRYAATMSPDTKIARSTVQTHDGTQVVIYATNDTTRKRKLQRLDGGVLWHPLFGRFPRRDPRNRWFEQEVRPGWFTKPVQDAVPEVRQAITEALDEVVRKAVGE
jgi:hypothetical protein